MHLQIGLNNVGVPNGDTHCSVLLEDYFGHAHVVVVVVVKADCNYPSSMNGRVLYGLFGIQTKHTLVQRNRRKIRCSPINGSSK